MSRRMTLYRKNPLPSHADLFFNAQRSFAYHKDGRLTYKIDPRHPECTTSKFIGKQVGGDDGNGYLMCMLMGHKFKVHQIVWLLHFGTFPTQPIDHINRNRRDNRIENLRLCTDLQNGFNRSTATSPTAGAYYNSRNRKYVARVGFNGKRIYLGYFATQELAHAAYLAARAKLMPEFNAT